MSTVSGERPVVGLLLTQYPSTMLSLYRNRTDSSAAAVDKLLMSLSRQATSPYDQLVMYTKDTKAVEKVQIY